MNFFNKFPNNTKCIKLPIVININRIVFIPDDYESIIMNETFEWDCKYLVSVNTSSGLPLTKHGIPFLPIRFVNISFDYLLNNLGVRSTITGITIIDEDADYTQSDRGISKLDDNDIINWPQLKIALEDRIRSSYLIKYDENISNNIYLSLVCTKIY